MKRKIVQVNTIEINENSIDVYLTKASSIVIKINQEPKLLPIIVNVILQDGDTLNGEIIFSASIEYNENGRNDKSPLIQGRSSTSKVEINFGNIIIGGNFKFEMDIPCKNIAGSYTQKLVGSSQIGAMNPSKQNIKQTLNNIELQVISYKESRFRQFNNDGMPLFGPPNGFGIMQIDTPVPTSNQIWNWKDNIDAGMALYNIKITDAKSYPARTRKKFPDAKNFTQEELKLETYQRYNGGNYWKWDDTLKIWIKDNSNGYADDCYRIEKLVNTGNPPNEWN